MTPEPFLRVRRRTTDQVMVALAWTAAMTALAVLAFILFELLRRGISALSIGVFTQTTPSPGGTGGLLNPIIGSLAMTGIAILGATPLGVLAGTYLAEYGRRSRLADAVRFLNDTLLSAPSIIIGLFVYGIAVKPVGHFSGWAGALALCLIALPVIVRTTEDMLRMIPEILARSGDRARHAALADDRQHRLSGGSERDLDRHPALGGPHFRRNGAAAVHRPQQSVSEFEPERADRQPAGGDFPVRHRVPTRTGRSWPGSGPC